MESKFGIPTKYTNAVESLTKKSLSNFEFFISGSIIAVPVFLSLSVLFKTLLSSPEKTSSTLLAKENLEKGLYSKD